MKYGKVGCLVLVSALTISLFSSCGKESKAGIPATTSSDSQRTSTAAPLVTLNFMANFTPAQNNSIGVGTMKKLEEKLNLKINLDISPASNYREKIQITLASGTLPDAIIFDDTTDTILKSGASNGTFIDVSKHLQKASNITKYTLPGSFNAVKYLNDEKIFGIIRSTVVRADGVAYRADWLKTLGITGVETGKPITLEKFKEILQKIAENDPDGNGKKDTYGLSLYVGSENELVPLYAANAIDVVEGAFGINGWQKTTGEDYAYMDPRFSKKSQNFKKFLEFMASLYKNKLVDPDWPIIKQGNTDFEKGKYGAGIFFPTNLDATVQKLKAVNPNADAVWTSGIINPDAGKVTGTTYATGAWGCWAITKTCKNPERIVELFDYMLSDEFYTDNLIYGGETLGFNTVNGKKIPTETYKTPDSTGWNSKFIRRAGDTSVYLKLSFDEETKQRYDSQIKTAIGNAVISLDGGYIPTAAADAKFIDYKKIMNTGITKIILGEAPISSYDALLDGWYKSGGEAYVKDMNDHIKAMTGK